MNTRQSSAIRLRPVCLLGLLALLSGCGHRATVVLEQPHARPAQQRLKLASDWAFSMNDGPRRLVQLDFPLPGGVNGPRDFRLLVMLPGVDGWQSVGESGGGPSGFLIQAAPGELHGKSLIASGRVRARGVFLSPREKLLDLELRLEDGSTLRGSARVVEDDRELRAFRARYGADIAALATRAAPEVAADKAPAVDGETTLRPRADHGASGSSE